MLEAAENDACVMMLLLVGLPLDRRLASRVTRYRPRLVEYGYVLSDLQITLIDDHPGRERSP